MSLPLILAAFGLVFHFGGKEIHRFERLASQNLAATVTGDHKKVSVRLKLASFQPGHLSEVQIDASDFSTPTLPLWTEPWRSKVGIIERLNINLTNFTLGSLPIQELDLNLNDNRWDYALAVREGAIRLSRSGKGTFKAIVTESGLKTFIGHRFPDIKTSVVRIESYKIVIEGQISFLMGKIGFDIILVPQVRPEVGIDLFMAYLGFEGKQVPSSLEAAIRNRWTRLIDLDRDFELNGALTVTKIRLEPGSAILEGTAILPEATRKQGSGSNKINLEFGQ